MVIRELLVKLGFDVDEKQLKMIDSGVDNIKSSMLSAAATFGAIGTSLFLLTRNIAKMGDEAKKSAEAIGVSTEALQELNYAAALGNVSSQEMTTSLAKLNKLAYDASQGLGQAQNTFKNLGVSIYNSNGELKTSDILFEDLSDTFKTLPEGPKRTALAMELFGRAGTKMIPMLKQGSQGIKELRQEAIDMGAVISGETAAASEEFNDSITRMQWLFRGLKIAIAKDLIPLFTSWMKQVMKWYKLNGQIIKQNLTKIIGTLVNVLKYLYFALSRVLRLTNGVLNVFGGLEKVIKYVTYAFLAFISAQFLVGIGQITMAVINLTKSFKALRIGILLTQAAAIWPFILIGAAVVALILIIEDLYTWWSNGDSVFKSWTESLFSALEASKNFFIGFFQFVGGLWGEFMQPIYEGFNFISEKFSKFGGFFSKFFGGGKQEIEPTTSNTNGSSNVNMNAPITVNVPQGTPPELVGESVQAGMKGAFETLFRETGRATEPMLEY